MASASLHRSLNRSVFWFGEHTLHLWILAVVFYGFGDLGTTFIGLSITGIVETGPVAAPLLRTFGFQFIVVLKVVFFVACFVLWRLVPDPMAVGVPLSLGVLGIFVSFWNVSVIIGA